MSHSVKRIGNKTLSIVLSVMMVISTLLVSIVSVNATITGLSALYFTPSKGSWTQAGAQFKLQVVEQEEEIIDFVKIGDTNVYKAELDPAKTYNSFKFLRVDPNNSGNIWNESNAFYSIPNGTNHFTLYGNIWSNWNPSSSNNGTWDYYNEDSGSVTTVWYLIGGPFGVWNPTMKDYPLDETHPTDPDVVCRTVTFNEGDTFFRLSDGSAQYAGSYDRQPLGDSSSKITLTPQTNIALLHSGASTVRICVDTKTREIWEEVVPLETYNVNIGTQENCTISVDPQTASEGQTVTVTVAPNDGYVCSGVTVDPATEVSGSGNTYTFKMPASDVTVSATTRAAETYSVTASVNNEAMGSVSVAPSNTVTEGTSVTVTASANTGYAFKEWQVESGTYAGDLTSSEITFVPTDDVELMAVFEESLGEETGTYLLVTTNNSNRPSAWAGNMLVLPVYNVSGTYTAYLETTLNSTINYYFGLSTTQDVSGMVNVTGVSYVTNGSVSAYAQNYNNDNGKDYNFSYFRVSNPNVNKITFEFSSITSGNGNITYTLTASEDTTPEDPNKVTINAKDGTIVDNVSTTSDYGSTTLLSGYDEVISDDPAVHYSVYTATKGSMIRIQTSVAENYYNAGYYVGAYVINGETVRASSQGNGKYEASYLLSESLTSKSLEITPVYFNSHINENDDYITFYVDASEVLNDEYASKLAGNTLAVYTYYYTGETGTAAEPDAKKGDGSYPGQPMLRDNNGKYFTKVAKYYYDENGQKTEYAISGVVVSNYSNDKLHNQFMVAEGKANAQTYDYDDLVQIDRNGYDVVEFKMQYSRKRTNQNILLNDATNNPDVASHVDLSLFTNNNGWDIIKDYDGNETSLLGNILTEEDMSKDELRIVSVGNQNIAGHGQWSTVWYVFDKDGNYITRGVPSDFLPRLNGTDENTAAYKAIEAAGYANSPAYVSYESISGADSRVDGQWYYSKSIQEVTGSTMVQYADSSDSDSWTTDVDGTTGNTATIAGETSITVNRNTTVEISATAGDGYMFVEWGYLDEDGNYKAFAVNANQQVSEVNLDKSYTFVARFVKVSDQTLIFNHNKYTGPGALGGGGYYYLSIVRHGTDGSTETLCTRAENTFALQVNPIDDDYFTVTLITHMMGKNEFVNWYRLDGTEYQIVEPEDAVVPVNQEVSFTFDVYVDDIYDNEKLLVNTFNYYSDIASVTAEAVLNYEYIDRFGGKKTYTVNLTLDDTYIDTNGYKITKDLIYNNAPYIDDLYKNCTWEITDQKYTSVGTTATLTATQVSKPCNVTITVSEGDIETPISNIPYNSYLTKEDGSFYSCDDPNFSYWIVYEFGTTKEVAKCFSKEFNLKIVDDYDIVAVFGDPAETSMSIGTPTYSREQYTDEAGNKYDYLYADFIVSVMDSKYTLLNSTSDSDPVQYRTGLMVEISQNTKLDPNTSTDYSDITFASDDEKLMSFATSGRTSTNRYAMDGDNRVVYNYTILNSDYNNLNRLDYFVKFQNSSAMQLYVMKAYYYVYQVDANGDIIPDSYQITEAVYFNLYQIANQSN